VSSKFRAGLPGPGQCFFLAHLGIPDSPEAQGDYVSRVQAFVRKHAHLFDRRPVTKEEWDEASGDTPEQMGLPK